MMVMFRCDDAAAADPLGTSLENTGTLPQTEDATKSGSAEVGKLKKLRLKGSRRRHHC